MSNLLTVTTCNLHGNSEINLDLRRTIESIRRYSHSPLLIVDDGSPIEYREFVKSLAEEYNAECRLLPENVGIGAAKNKCLQAFLQSQHDVAFLLDDDIEVLSPDWEHQYANSLTTSGFGILSYNDPTYTSSLPFDLDGFAASKHPCGVCVVLSRQCVEKTGLYLQLPGKWGEEHVEYGRRAAGLGFAPPGMFMDLWGSFSLIRIASHQSVFTLQEKEISHAANARQVAAMEGRAEGVSGITSYKGILCQQIGGFVEPMARFLREYEFTHVLELGTGYGGFTHFVKDTLPAAVIQTWDHAFLCNPESFETREIEFIHASVYSDNGLLDPRIQRFIKDAESLVVFVDSGDKLMEFCRVAELLRQGDLILAHDYADSTEVFERELRGRIWNWLEITGDQIKTQITCEQLVPCHPELKRILWGCFKSLPVTQLQRSAREVHGREPLSNRR